MTRIIKLEIENRFGLETRLNQEFLGAFDSIRRLARKHHRLAEMSCNGAGCVNGQSYYGGKIDDWARREYGAGVKSAYGHDPKDPERSIFDVESDKIEHKIMLLTDKMGGGVMVTHQGDPRGYTTKLSYQGRDVSDLL